MFPSVEFLAKDERIKLELLQALEEAPELTRLNTTLQAQLGLSDFLFKKTIMNLSQDFEDHGLDYYFSLDSNEVQTQLQETGYATSELLLAIYVKNSLMYQVTLAICREEFVSPNAFAIENYLSYTKVYNSIQTLKKNLQDTQIQLSKDYHWVGDEATLRFGLASLFTFVLGHDYEIYPNDCQRWLTGIVDSLVQAGFSMTRNGQVKLSHLLAVSLLREQQGHPITLQDKNKVKVHDRLKVIYQAEYQLIQEKLADPELADTVLAFLYTNALLPGEKMLGQGLGERISRLNRRFIQQLVDHFEITDCQIEDKLWSDLTRLHYEIAYFPLNTVHAYQRFDVSYFQESYLEYFVFCRNYLQDQSFVTVEGLEEQRFYLFYKYLLILVNRLSITNIMPQLQLCIDFSFGQEYNAFIQKNLQFFVIFNLAVQFDYTESTDLVLTDLNAEYEAFEVETVIWLDPPRPTDWGNLANRLLELCDKKRRKQADISVESEVG